jgi:hypothetical protein|mmetsp:Transcript_69857/g.116397  ORF Transcript_69857/g.116397 Transcript_69857/m.116397 type:complete len:600 (-) Transcript_69857:561-2360(-)|eukprot:CAMPEP_0174303154 /NCGR_PEP_ID=MMETSP0809-20121228/60017_1 /TAXON_ID=73025 ORGANISM="Eutreptiella gymnastica-like, Strain CCMP1594" /NCGR_SAMPLE_ID=MMETSP0809 /ASSEMBLY_ACC=CAM_ASM_000658 /LENGTH=599 /DNA_ID=CAMNT_0015409123 /DNA_START=63 /DNA_END=1862 /DNA_ORIENTATION=-
MDITPGIVQDICSQCQKKGFIVSQQLASFYAKTLLIQEQRDTEGAVELGQAQVQNVVATAVSRLTQSDSASLETFKMQAAVLSQQQDAVNQQRTEMVQHRAKSQQLLTEVCNRGGNHAKVFGDMVLYILHETGLYNASNKELVQKETMTALESVIPRQSIESFVAQSDVEKMKQLDELWKIVWGIRIFNRETHKGGAGIQDVPGEIAAMVSASQTTINQQLENMQAIVNDYFACLTTNVLAGVSPGEQQRINEEYMNRLQYVQFLKKTARAVEEVATQMVTARPAYDALLAEIKHMVTSSTSVPKSTVYPKFIDVGERWESFKKVHTEMKRHKRTLEVLLGYQQSYTQVLKQGTVDEATKLAAEQEKPKPDQVALEQEVNSRPSSGCMYTPVLPKSATVEFEGFCIVSVMKHRMMKPVMPEVGYIRYQGKIYGFADENAMRAFTETPQAFVDGAIRNQALADISMIHLLNLGGELPTELYFEGTRQQAMAAEETRKVDSDTQTGQIDPYKDYKYQWNEWELRRLALKLADLRNKRTHSCQTHLSHFKRDNDTQTYPKKQTGSQTLVEKSTQGKHKARYIAGLRGDPDSKVKVVSVEFDE